MEAELDIERDLPEGVEIHHLSDEHFLKLGGYVELHYDAKLHFEGLDWYRVRGGFGGHFDREDWVADVPYVSTSITRYHNHTRFDASFGKQGRTMAEAMRHEVRYSLRSAPYEMEKYRAKIAELSEGMSRLERSVELQPEDTP